MVKLINQHIKNGQFENEDNLLGGMIQFDEHIFSGGLKPPTSVFLYGVFCSLGNHGLKMVV